MHIKLSVALLISASFCSAAVAQTISDEKAIREEIAAFDNRIDVDARHTDDIVYWPGSFKRPMVGRGGERVLVPGAADRLSSRSKATVRRLEIAQSRDMAWEFSDAEVTVEEKVRGGNTHTRTFTTSQLRVWKKSTAAGNRRALPVLAPRLTVGQGDVGTTD